MTFNKFIPVAQPDLGGNEKKYVDECIQSSWISSKGKFIDRFEKEFAEYIGVKYAVSTSNGTTALHLAITALGIGKGNEVIVPDLTFIACANTVAYTGAKPVFVDVEKNTWNIDPAKIEEKITPRTRAIMAVHLYGHPADLNKILILAQKYKLLVIEDAAEAHGAEIKVGNQWRKVGSIGEVGCFSFYGNKIITTGEGGMVVTNNKKLAEKMKILRDHGQTPERRYYHEIIGFNYRMTNVQAAIGCAQLERINEFIIKKRNIAKLFNKYLSQIPGITPPPGKSWAKSVYWMYSILIDQPFFKSRDQLVNIMAKEGIETRPFFYPLHTLPPYKEIGNYPISNYLSLHGINLPSSVTINKADILKIIGVLKKLGRIR